MPQANAKQTVTGTSQSKKMGIFWTCLIGLYLAGLSAVLMYVLVQILCIEMKDAANPAFQTLRLFARDFAVCDKVYFILIVIVSGGLGALVHAIRSFYKYVGNRLLVRSWFAMYGMLPLIGAILGLLFYLVIRGGFFTSQTNLDQTNPFGFAALAGLVGMFSEPAVLKLREIAETIFTKTEPEKDPINNKE
jgi:hypothetical protein